MSRTNTWNSNSLGSNSYIGENISLINNVMEITKTQNLPGILTSLDFRKAFHCVKWGVSWCWNHTIRTRILREYGHTRTYRVSRHATCPLHVRNRICSDSDLTRVIGNLMSGYVIDTRRVETWKFPYTFRFATNNNVPHTSAWSVNLRLSFRVFLKIVFSTVVRIVSLSVRPEIPRY